VTVVMTEVKVGSELAGVGMGVGAGEDGRDCCRRESRNG
jgi:hypothetical protein